DFTGLHAEEHVFRGSDGISVCAGQIHTGGRRAKPDGVSNPPGRHTDGCVTHAIQPLNDGTSHMKGRPVPVRTPVIDGKLLPEVLDETMIHAVVHGFYDQIRSDDLLGPIFNNAIADADWPHHLAKMCDFWSSTLLRTGRYDGRPLPPHLAIPELGEHHFRRWLKLFPATVRSVCPP